MWSVATRNAVLDFLLKTGTTQVSLHDNDPGIAGGNELVGGSYARQPLSATQWNAASSAISAANSALTWTGLPASTITHVGLWNGSTFVMGGELGSPIVRSAGEGLVFPAGALRALLEAGTI